MDGADIEVAPRAQVVLDVYKKLASSHRREYLKWISEAKSPATRARRIQKMCAMLSDAQN